ncbi:ATP-binding protein [Fundidesulfovibrio terrae]|uniref:ATP-binding protein n=1 Tax=Fundidesulfovibrio terrae TaxID=2922866 RepID=UPI001FAF1ECC|nr:ATP-binding protein [Fundidesulfovibrio terrae]
MNSLTNQDALHGTVLGQVISVSNSSVIGLFIQANENDTAPKIQVGDLVKIETTDSTIYGMINECSTITQNPPSPDQHQVHFNIDLFGEIARSATGKLRFKRGIASYPSLGQSIKTVSEENFREIYTMPYRKSVKIGTLHQNQNVSVGVDVDDLISKHFAILGSTGSGKSCSLAVLLNAILQRYPHGHVILIDPHNEYKMAFGHHSEYIDVSSIELPYWLLNFHELTKVICQGDASQYQTQSDILLRCVTVAKADHLTSIEATQNITIDSPSPYRMSRVRELICEEMGKLDKQGNTLPYQAILTRIDQLQHDKRFGFMFADFVVRDIFPDILAKILRIPTNGKPITILNLSGTPGEIINIIVSLIARIVFDFAVWSHNETSPPILFVCEEAHRYIPSKDETATLPASHAIARIAQEGRKYGVGLGLVTQRPSDISERILSQCNTLICLRLTTSSDQDFISHALPENCLSIFKALPSLRTRDAIIVGDAVSTPMRIRIDMLEPEHMPRRQSLAASSLWESDTYDSSLITNAVKRWRGNAQ